MRLAWYLQQTKHMMRKTQNTTGTQMAVIIRYVGSCFAASCAAALMSNSLLSSLGLLQPYELYAKTRNAYLHLSSSPEIIQDVSKILVIINNVRIQIKIIIAFEYSNTRINRIIEIFVFECAY